MAAVAGAGVSISLARPLVEFSRSLGVQSIVPSLELQRVGYYSSVSELSTLGLPLVDAAQLGATGAAMAYHWSLPVRG